MSNLTFLRVSLPTPLRQAFDYRVPASIDNPVCIGLRVRVPFGPRKLIGVITEIDIQPDYDTAKIKPIIEIIDREPLLRSADLALLHWASNYYQHPLGEVIANALPSLLRKGAAAEPSRIMLWRAHTHASTAMLARAPRQAALLTHLQTRREGFTQEQLRDQPGDWRGALRQLEQRGLIESVAIATTPAADNVALTEPLRLSPDQQAAVDTIRQQPKGFSRHLLHGITGSGKTEVYLQVIQPLVEQHGQCLVLVPEISLTPQIVSRFRQRLSVPVCVLHSGLSDRERLNNWLLATSGKAKVIIGTRSAVFTPLPDLALIVVDEEHDLSLKQQDGFRYNARDIAVYRAQQNDIPIVLGSATPSLESLLNVEQGRYKLSHLPKRAGAAIPPSVQLLDVRSLPMRSGISEPLLHKITQIIARGEQVLLFLNRRGYAPVLMCHDCGWIANCGRCDARMTLHQSRRILACHHCGREVRIPKQCPECTTGKLHELGQGTERIEQTLVERFPATGIARIDRDTVRRQTDFTQLLERIHSGEIQLLVGTQMLAKGHDFPNVTLVALLDSDQGLFGSDFRAAERMAQLITQVSGRAGRGDKPGQVIIQTHHPEHPILQTLLTDGYSGFSHALLMERSAAALPPYTCQAMLRAESTDAAQPLAFLEQARNHAMQIQTGDVQLWGTGTGADGTSRRTLSRATAAASTTTRAATSAIAQLGRTT